MKKINLFLAFLMPLLFFGQLDTYYAYYQTTGNFYDLYGATQIYQNADSDDGSVTNIPLGFDFDYNGSIYNTCTISVNGAISFTETQVDYTNDLGSSQTYSKNVMAPLWDDLYKRTSDNGIIQYKTDGTAPYRRFYVEWKNISWRDTGQTVSFMLVLQETTNNIEFRYGPNNANYNNRTASIGINDSSAHFMSVTPGNPATVSSLTANNNIGTSQYPGEGTFYLFKHLT
ncbi:MAG TPA: hypothetical protein ENK67_07380, partial [Flavobacteriia bacterium]|nr:hypothetical protein [Flavobacteriia bacterium]